jgi:hypothetical protein
MDGGGANRDRVRWRGVDGVVQSSRKTLVIGAQASRPALSVGALAGLDQGEEPGGAGAIRVIE